MLNSLRILPIGILLVSFMFSCKKNKYDQPIPPSTTPPTTPNNFKLSYGDSVFYLQNGADDYIVTPSNQMAGQYSAFPDGIDLDGNTGAINVSKSETGLKYRISFVPTGSTDSFSTVLVISGINFLDGFYKLSDGDSIARPLYNASFNNTIPGLNNGSVFDVGSNCNSNGCTVNVGDGQINLAQTVRNGVFGATPSNNDRHEFDLNYQINDKSGKALNTIRVKLYYFDTMDDVTQEVYDIISSREGTILDASPILFASKKIAVNDARTNSSVAINAKAAKPRPPCLFIVSH